MGSSGVLLIRNPSSDQLHTLFKIGVRRLSITLSIVTCTPEMLVDISMNQFNDPKDPYRTTSLVSYVDAANVAPAVREKLNVLPFRRNIFLLLGQSSGLFS